MGKLHKLQAHAKAKATPKAKATKGKKGKAEGKVKVAMGKLDDSCTWPEFVRAKCAENAFPGMKHIERMKCLSFEFHKMKGHTSGRGCSKCRFLITGCAVCRK